MNTSQRDLERAKAHDETGRCAFESIHEMVCALRAFDESHSVDPLPTINGDAMQDREAVEERIHEDPLTVLVRDGWHEPGKPAEDGPEEYEILLSTGGPATRIRGELDDDCQPKTARLEVQDWFVPWKEWRGEGWSEEVLLDYARCFWFGE